MATEIIGYNQRQSSLWREICDHLAKEAELGLPEAIGKVWHGGPVWFLESNPIVGYWVRRQSVQLLSWSGQSFDEPGLSATESSGPRKRITRASIRWMRLLCSDG